MARDEQKLKQAQARYNERRTAKRRAENGESPGATPLTNSLESIRTIERLLRKNGVDPSDIGAVKAVRLNEWQVAAKNDEGELVTETLSASSIVLDPSWAEGPKWPLIEPAKPVQVEVPKASSGPYLAKGWRTCVFLPDPQIGFRRLADGSLDPFHDERALNIALQVVEAERPKAVVHAGDYLDLAPMSTKFRQEAGFALTVQPALDRAYEFLASIAEMVEYQKLISGNHDVRLQTYSIDNALASFGLRPGGSASTTWPDLSVQRLLRLDECNTEYVGSYPHGAFYINDNLACLHGRRIGNVSKTAAQRIVEDERVSVLHGHTHKKATAYKTRNTRGAAKISFAHSPGCLCRIDGAVPSTNGAIDAFGRPIKAFEDWQQGLAVIRYQEGDGKFALEDVLIHDGFALHRGQEFRAAA